MGIREYMINLSKGDTLSHFWRLYHWKQQARHRIWLDILIFCMNRCAARHGGYVGADAIIHGIPSLPHGLHGVYISRYAEIGENCRIYQNVTIGEYNQKAPVIGKGCLIGAGAVLIGNIKIGDGVKIGAGAVVCTDVPAHCTVVSQPAKILERSPDV